MSKEKTVSKEKEVYRHEFKLISGLVPDNLPVLLVTKFIDDGCDEGIFFFNQELITAHVKFDNTTACFVPDNLRKLANLLDENKNCQFQFDTYHNGEVIFYSQLEESKHGVSYVQKLKFQLYANAVELNFYDLFTPKNLRQLANELDEITSMLKRQAKKVVLV